ncbi:hypothetical protein VPHD249_0099 [Vibrio phage D249]|nr:hypothetical protein SIPHO036v1_90005 [Vibrio phage 70E38.1]QZI87998.1 hypothetical protein SIPHO041v1_p0087 [Vibrio phage 234P1]QZI88170.1 hypothetical protein SIPHO035v1_p0079 [Vibrio phage 234P7B]QZI88361.1 hypothetical protein SIPHO082v1_p0084 [Vibrio phage 294E48.1]QZI88538.1 hypothetical protein SIPHO037v1_p0097 [Vibrio phage 70E35.2]QZI88722.1 hypothetical protein SIPHO039v1_p0093 [Vibrio phage 70E35.5a]QZI88905.1 hypothetical protein SIPHO040v1_p0092 [Vibrio phage 70E35.6]QZI89115
MYFVLVNPQGHYLARNQNDGKSLITTRHLQEARWLLHKNYEPEGFKLKELRINLR